MNRKNSDRDIKVLRIIVSDIKFEPALNLEKEEE